MINLNRNMEEILQSQRDRKISKERHRQINKTIVAKFVIKSLSILLMSNMLVEEMDVKHRENKKMSYWVEHQRKIYRQFLRDDHTPLTPERKSTFEKIGFFGRMKRGVQLKGPHARKNQVNQKREYARFYFKLK